jgi:hypothetical protein
MGGEDRSCLGVGTSGKEQAEREDEGGEIWYFVFMYKNRTMKPVETVLRKGRGRMRDNDGGGESN